MKKYFDKGVFRHNGIGRRMIVALILFSSIITAIITVAELYVDYRSDISSIKNNFSFISQSYLPTLTESVWVADDTQIQTELDGLSRLQDIESLTIFVNGEKRWFVTTNKSRQTMSVDVPLVRRYHGQNLNIGTLRITASIDNVFRRLVDKLITVLISNGIKTLLVAVFMLLIFQFMVGRHLEHIADFLRNISKSHDNSDELKLSRDEHGRWRPDALDQVVDAFNAMRHNQFDHNRQIHELNKNLDNRVRERTTELEQLNSQLRQALIRLEESNKAKSIFLSRMSHELRTPLNAICGFSYLLEMEPLNDDQREYIEWIHKSGDHLLSLINDLLDLSRIETNKLSVFIEPVSITSILDNAISMTNGEREKKGITLEDKCQTDYTVLADATRVSQIAINLMTNAIKYTQDGGTISIECYQLAEPKVRICISDTGQGIAEDKQHLVFTAFERLGAEFTEIEGTGTGLALSKHLAELMNGEMGFESKQGTGSSFWLDLNLSQEGIQSESATQAIAATQDQQHFVVLYVEDNLANLRMVENVFKHHPEFTFLSATNGPEGIEIALNEQPDLILLDIHLPKMDGYEILKQLKADARTAHVPVIAVTADAMSNEINRGLQAGFRRYLTKPIKPSELIAIVSAILNSGS